MKKYILLFLLIPTLCYAYSHKDYKKVYKLVQYLKIDTGRLKATTQYNNVNYLVARFYSAVKKLAVAMRDIYDNPRGVELAYYEADDAFFELNTYMSNKALVMDKDTRYVWNKKVKPKFLKLRSALFALKIITEEREYIDNTSRRIKWKYEVKPLQK